MYVVLLLPPPEQGRSQRRCEELLRCCVDGCGEGVKDILSSDEIHVGVTDRTGNTGLFYAAVGDEVWW